MPKLYEGKAFKIEETLIAAAKKYLFVTDGGETRGPTSKQQEVIFTDSAATTVLAGAGSGKSTTLVSRVLFLHKFLGVAFSNMAVFTFTRKSRADFIEKLVKEAKRWEVKLTEVQADKIVRTFHSKALQVARCILTGDEQIFEFLGKKPAKDADRISTSSDDLEGMTNSEDDANKIDGFVELNESPEQAEILKDVYVACYNENENFREAIASLFEYTVVTEKLEQSERYNQQLTYIKGMCNIDEAVCSHVEEKWTVQGCWPIPGVRTNRSDGSRYQLEVPGAKLYANGYIEALDIYVVLGRYENISSAPVKAGQHTFKPQFAVNNRRLVLLVGCASKIRYVKSTKDADDLKKQLQLVGNSQALSAPAISIRLPGEYSAKPIFSTLYTFGVFAENLGLQPTELPSQLKSLERIEQLAVYVVGEFFKRFYAELKGRRLVTFNQIFARLGEGSPDLDYVELGPLMGVKHLMIDEFQDISPLVVKFVNGLHSELCKKSQRTQKPSLMCVGDDWQSIYGWRGSSPHFLLEFKKHFPGASANPILLRENFRSSQLIIDCGEAFIAQVKKKSDKPSIASHRNFKDLPFQVGYVDDYRSEDVFSALSTLLNGMKADEQVYLLATTHDELDKYKNIKDKRLTKTTFHQSKGLEAEYVVLLGAPNYFGSNSLKSALYVLAEFPQKFDEAAKDEALRVAYVAATRAKKLCIWFAKSSSSSVMAMVPSDGVARIALSAVDMDSHLATCFDENLTNLSLDS